MAKPILFLACLLVGAPAATASCYCPVETACQRMTGSQVIFLGETVAQGDRTVLRVLESFRGVPQGVSQIAVEAVFTKDCPSPYQTGKLTLVFLNPEEDGVMRDGPCSRSFLVPSESPDLPLVRRYAAEGLKTLIQGVVTTPGNGSELNTPVRGALIEAQRDEGPIYSTVSDDDGHFEFANFPPGNYQINSRAAGYRNVQGPVSAVLPASGCAVADLALAPTNSIAGVVRDETGQPVQGVRVSLLHRDIQLYSPRFTRTNPRGEYRFESVAIGPYHLVASEHGPTPKSPYDPVYFPGTTLKELASVLTVGPGAKLTEKDLRLNPRYSTRTVTVSATWPDGAPANGSLTCRHPSIRGSFDSDFVSRGAGECTVLAGHAFTVSVTPTPKAKPPETLYPPGAGDLTIDVVFGIGNYPQRIRQ